ncbi:MAG TPA: sugar phosphate isomerase/epimerase [Bryobacteraceae bacterium]
MPSRRTVLLAPLAAPLSQMIAPAVAASGKMSLCIHQNTSRSAGYRKSLEGWAKAGIKNVELTDTMLDEFLKTGSLADAKRILTDNGLTPVSSAAVLPDLWITGPAHAASLETWKKRCDQFSSIGLTKIYCPSTTNRKVTEEDYKKTPDCIREAGDIAKQHNMTALIEFARSSTHIATLTTSLKMIREAAHPNVRPHLDFYHFWSGMGKFEDLDLLHPGELAHVHFQDTPDIPRELFSQTTRLIPGDGVTPIVPMLKKLSEKGYSGALSVELFLPELTQGDPYEVAKTIREKCEVVMHKAKVA